MGEQRLDDARPARPLSGGGLSPPATMGLDRWLFTTESGLQAYSFTDESPALHAGDSSVNSEFGIPNSEFQSSDLVYRNLRLLFSNLYSLFTLTPLLYLFQALLYACLLPLRCGLEILTPYQ